MENMISTKFVKYENNPILGGGEMGTPDKPEGLALSVMQKAMTEFILKECCQSRY